MLDCRVFFVDVIPDFVTVGVFNVKTNSSTALCFPIDILEVVSRYCYVLQQIWVIFQPCFREGAIVELVSRNQIQQKKK